jgi:hypothetical protein
VATKRIALAQFFYPHRPNESLRVSFGHLNQSPFSQISLEVIDETPDRIIIDVVIFDPWSAWNQINAIQKILLQYSSFIYINICQANIQIVFCIISLF